jgi:hypothetical protein
MRIALRMAGHLAEPVLQVRIGDMLEVVCMAVCVRITITHDVA